MLKAAKVCSELYNCQRKPCRRHRERQCPGTRAGEPRKEPVHLCAELVLWKHTATFLPWAEGEFFRKAPSHDKRWNKPRSTTEHRAGLLCRRLHSAALPRFCLSQQPPSTILQSPCPRNENLFLSFSYKTPAKPDGVNYIRTDDEVTNDLHLTSLFRRGRGWAEDYELF